ncbi:hypothetical protein SAY87_001273 [Trapa incisa]|uniref:T-complex protein 11 n=1 Tax=Trapa incisa TaxID=236973 RepID=A0AAN7JH78_9MYRT|nr:hypothetical protein SAY87_001273 [Trapa incisa]
METPDKSPTAIVLDFPVRDEGGASPFSWPPRMPTRLRRRLLADCGSRSPSTVEEIEAKLRDAHLRRQQFYEKLSSKARPKQRSPSRASSQEDDLGQRLEAKLLAAEQKRQSILAKEQLRLAKLDELRQAAKCEVELRLEKERENLGTKVETRIQQAEENRLLILKAYKQRRATLKERSSQSLLRRMARENKYKERVHAAINQKRAAAEKKRLKLLEAEKKRACARMLQVQRVAELVSHQREVERKKLQVQLEDRLQRAKRQRAEYLRQRGVRQQRSFGRMNRVKMYKQGDILSRKLARCWKQFLKMQRTTLDLAKAHGALGINEASVKTMPFEQLAILIESVDTLRTVKGLLDRLESRLRVSRAVSVPSQPSSLENIDHLLKRVATPKKRPLSRTPSRAPRGKEARKVVSRREAAKAPASTSRYPVRVVLCTYMILGHPDAVFSGLGEREIALAMSAREFVQAFELLIRIILDGPIQSSDEEYDSAMPRRWTFKTQLAAFDRAWCTYLSHFVAWKVKDAKMLEDDLVRAACQLELSMIQTCKMTAEGETGTLTHDMKAIQKQVTEDQKLLREKVLHLSGDAGIERMEVALRETRSNYFRVRGSGSPASSSITNNSPSSVASPLAMSGLSERNRDPEKPSRVVRSLFKEDVSPLPNEFGSLASDMDGNQVLSSQNSVTENEMIVNGLLHDYGSSLADGLASNDEDKNTIKGKVRLMMEKAFWDGVMESMEGDKPQSDRVVQLMEEMRDGICEIAPESWKEEIIGTIDLNILTQVLKSGNLDMDYLVRILKFALGTLQRLSSPSKDDEMKTSHNKLIEELSQICQSKGSLDHPHRIAMVRGIRFVLEQIQVLKSEISKTRILLMEPMLKGPAGFEYLRSAFAKRFGDASDAATSLPLTCQWISSVKTEIDMEWSEHTTSLSSISQQSSSHGFLPSAVLRTGGSFLVQSNISSGFSTKDNGLQECKGEQLDLLVRIGLLKLVCGVSGLTHETLPETFMLNLFRLRAIQAQIQKTIVISTSILVCRQTILSERVVSSSADMESVLSNSTQRLAEFLDKDEDAGIEEIVDILSDFPAAGGKFTDSDIKQSRKAVMGRMLAKCLQAGDPIFERVSHAVYLGLRAVVLGGKSPSSRKLTEMALRPIGAAIMAERVAEVAGVVGIAAWVSVQVHGQWYASIVNYF